MKFNTFNTYLYDLAKILFGILERLEFEITYIYGNATAFPAHIAGGTDPHFI